MLRTLLLTPLLIAVTAVFAQSNFSVSTYSTENGLPSNGIKGLQWDESTNFLWISTEAGAVRFNGIDFRIFNKENTPTITSERLLFFVRNTQGKMFTADQNRNILVVNKNNLQLFTKLPKEANMFLLPASVNLYRTNLFKKNRTNYFIPYHNVMPANDSLTYILFNRALVHYGINDDYKIITPETSEGIRSIFKIGDRFFINNKRNEIYELNPINEEFIPAELYNEDNKRFNIPNDHFLYWENGMPAPVLFIGSTAWKIKTDGKKLILQKIAENVPSGSFIKSVQYSEKEKLLFIGTDSKGLIVISQNRVQPVKKSKALRDERNAYYGQLELNDGTILTNEGHILGKTTKSKEFPPVSSFLISIFQTNDSLWYAHLDRGNNLLMCYNKRTGQTTSWSNLKFNGLQGVSYCNNRLFIVDQDGLSRFENDSLIRIKKWSSITYDLKEIEPGILWIATCNGLLRYNSFTNSLDTIFQAPDNCVRTIWSYRNYVFFGTYGKGYFIWKNGTVKPMPLDKNKYFLYTHCFMPDDRGYCWMSTNRGLFKANLEEIVTAWEKDNPMVYYHYFGKKDGMDITEMNGGCTPCAIRLHNNILSFPTMDGLLWVDPSLANPVLPTGPVYIDEILSDGKPVSVTAFSKDPLPATTKEINIALAFAAWCNKENIYIEYQVNEGEWRTLGPDAVIHFSNLANGDYKLKIRKLNGFGKNNFSYLDVHFTINTPWYKRWWFYLLLVFVFGLGLYLVIRLRIRHLKKLQYKLEKQVAEKTRELKEKNQTLEKADSIKTRLISIISHDIITPLKFMTAAGKNLMEKKEQMPAQLQEEAMQEITNTAQELQLLSTNILNWIKYQNEQRKLIKEEFFIHEMADQVCSILRSLANQKQLSLINEIASDMEVYGYYEPLKILIYNLTLNAINFSDKGTVILSAEQKNKETVISISDEGIGMASEQVKRLLGKETVISEAGTDNRKGHGLGYLIIKDLLKMLGATINIQSEKNKGTTVSIQLPKRNQKIEKKKAMD